MGIVAFAVLVAGCPTRPRDVGTPPPQRVEPAPQAVGRPYEVDSAQSLLTIQVYRAGTFARMGHNHVIASHELTGRVSVAEDLSRSSFDLSFPVTTLTIDEPELRTQAGEDFPPGVPDSAKEGTRKNLLGEALLDAERYPVIRLTSAGIEGSAPDLTATVTVSIKDQVKTVVVPVHYESQPEQIVVTGELPLKQTDLGLKPFSVMMGALEVLDDMKVGFRLVAHPQG